MLNGQNIMLLQPPLISFIWNATRDMKLQYLLGLEKFKATGQSLGNLKPSLQVRHYLMYTVCPTSLYTIMSCLAPSLGQLSSPGQFLLPPSEAKVLMVFLIELILNQEKILDYSVRNFQNYRSVFKIVTKIQMASTQVSTLLTGDKLLFFGLLRYVLFRFILFICFFFFCKRNSKAISDG